MSDQAFVDKFQPEVVKQVLARKILTGGLKNEDIHIITNTKWGEGMIGAALKQNKEFREAVEGVMGESALNAAPGFWSRFGEQATKNPGWFLLFLTGIGILAVGAKAIQAGAVQLK